MPKHRTPTSAPACSIRPRGLDSPGWCDVLVEDGPHFADLGPKDLFADGVPEGVEVVDCGGQLPGAGPGRHARPAARAGRGAQGDDQTASRAAAAGGVTTMVALPNTEPVVDDVAGVEFVARRAREVKLVKIFTYGAVTRRPGGQGADRARPAVGLRRPRLHRRLQAVADAQVMRRALAYARAFDRRDRCSTRRSRA